MRCEQISPNKLAENSAFDGHEEVYKFDDEHTGLKAIIALHDTSRGPAAGGCRYWRYTTEADALSDVLRLSKAMSFKNAMAGLPLGGGKAVIWTDREAIDREAFFEAFGRAVATLNGRYITAEDVGTQVSDMVAVAKETKFVCGLPPKDGMPGGDPSPTTAYGVFLGIGAAVKFRLARPSLEGAQVAVQGLGSVGFHLCELLSEAGAQLSVCDINNERTEQAADEFSALIVSPDRALEIECDVLAPCAMGGVLDKKSIPMIKSKIVAGAANNQLASDQDGELLRLRGILYAPDYVINAGGIIQVAAEYFGWEKDDVSDRVAAIPMSLQQIFDESDWRHKATNIVADELAKTKLSGIAPLRAVS